MLDLYRAICLPNDRIQYAKSMIVLKFRPTNYSLPYCDVCGDNATARIYGLEYDGVSMCDRCGHTLYMPGYFVNMAPTNTDVLLTVKAVNRELPVLARCAFAAFVHLLISVKCSVLPSKGYCKLCRRGSSYVYSHASVTIPICNECMVHVKQAALNAINMRCLCAVAIQTLPLSDTRILVHEANTAVLLVM